MFVRRYLGIFVVSVLLLLAFGIPGFAKNSGSVAIDHSVVVSGTALPAGQYAVRWEAQSAQASVQFIKDKRSWLPLNANSRIVGRNTTPAR